MALLLVDEKYSSSAYNNNLIPTTLPGGLKEGDIVTTTGYMHLVALEKDENTKDGDYHIQITLRPEWSDSCFIVEMPYAEFAAAALKSNTEANRKFIRTRILHDSSVQATVKGNIITPGSVFVSINGQLFYEAIHAKDMRNSDPAKNTYRGKKGMHSYTAWELHPITNIAFAPRAR